MLNIFVTEKFPVTLLPGENQERIDDILPGMTFLIWAAEIALEPAGTLFALEICLYHDPDLWLHN